MNILLLIVIKFYLLFLGNNIPKNLWYESTNFTCIIFCLLINLSAVLRIMLMKWSNFMPAKTQEFSVPYIKWYSICIETMHILLYTLNQRSPAFLAPGTGFMGDSFSMDRSGVGEGGGFRMIQIHYISWALHLYYYYISRTSDHQTLYPRGWGPLLKIMSR